MNINIYPNKSNYYKAESRLEKSIQSGKFATYTSQKKKRIWMRLCRYARQLGINIKSSVAAACIAAGLAIGAPTSAQVTFVQQTGANNPLDSAATRYFAYPTFVDIDGDGDQDAFIGSFVEGVKYYKNTGTASSPVFILQTGADNPLSSVGLSLCTLAFVDIDGDGDKDVFIGGESGNITYYQNTGTTSAPVFTLSSFANPLAGVSSSDLDNSAPSFVDIDHDGDMDVFIGSYDNHVFYYKNTGTASAAVFVQQYGSDNPLNGASIKWGTPTFVDLDNDGDIDAFIGSLYGPVSYFKNTGTASSPVFTLQSDADNPLFSIVTGTVTYPSFVDIDGDGDQDVFIGNYEDGFPLGIVSYYKNTSAILPLKLISFKGTPQTGYNEIQWQTVGEADTKSFEIERSNDGRNFAKIITVASHGLGNNTYSINDKISYNGSMFYRLKMIDLDGRFSYSVVISIISKQAGKVIIYPNPASNLININLDNTVILNTQAGIFDTKGKLVQSILINNDKQEVNIQSLADGMYVVKFADGSSVNFIKR